MANPVAKRVLVSWEEVVQGCCRLAEQLQHEQETDGFHPDAILGVARGGLVPAVMLAHMLGVQVVGSVSLKGYKGMKQLPKMTPNLQFPFAFAPCPYKKILVVDDICDSGRSLDYVAKCLQGLSLEYRMAVLHYKPKATHLPSFYAHQTTDWIVYPWEASTEGAEDA